MSTLERHRHREMLACPSLWPLYPALPLARPRGDGQQDLGVALCHESFYRPPRIAVIRANLLLLPQSLEQSLSVSSESFSSIDALLDAGWRID